MITFVSSFFPLVMAMKVTAKFERDGVRTVFHACLVESNYIFLTSANLIV